MKASHIKISVQNNKTLADIPNQSRKITTAQANILVFRKPKMWITKFKNNFKKWKNVNLGRYEENEGNLNYKSKEGTNAFSGSV